MSTVKGLVLVLSIAITALLIIPLIVNLALPNDAGKGIMYIVYFVACTGLAIYTGIVASKDVRKLSIAPLLAFLPFPFCFALVAGNMIWKMFLFSLFYLVCSYALMTVLYLYKHTEREQR